MRKQSFLDYWVSTLLVHPAKGVTTTGEVVTGYYPEVTGDGTLAIRGPNMDERIYKAALRGFERVGTRRTVAQLESGSYSDLQSVETEIETTQHVDSGRRGQVPSNRSVEQRLLELDSLLEKGLINEDEFKQARKAILDAL